eukprot:216062_1
MALVDLVSTLTIFLIILLIWIICTIYIIWQFYCSGRDEKLAIHGYLRKTTMTYLISYTFAYFCALLLAGLALNNHKMFWSPNAGFQILIIFISIAISIGFMSLYVFLTARLYYSFKPTMYAIKKRTIYMYIILSIIVAILLNVYAAIYFLLQPVLPDTFLFMSLPPALIALIINLYIAISLIYAFTHTLTKCATIRNEHSNSSKNVLSPRQSSYINVAARHCVLSCIGIIVFNICIPLTISSYVWILPHNIATYITTVSLCFIWHTIEMICVLLGFSFNKEYYWKCCSICDNKVHNWLQNIATKHLGNNVSKQITLNSTTNRASTMNTIVTDATHDVIGTDTEHTATIEINTMPTGSYNITAPTSAAIQEE